MVLFHQIIVGYDIVDTKIRTKLFETLKDFGLVSIQKSIMWGYINYAEEKAIRTLLKHMLMAQDKGFVLRVNNASEQIQKYGVGYKEMHFSEVDEPHII